MKQNKHFFGTVGAVYCGFLAVLMMSDTAPHQQVHGELSQPAIHNDASAVFTIVLQHYFLMSEHFSNEQQIMKESFRNL
jgi:succinate dehydrogenase hydrophobic anchor subunit